MRRLTLNMTDADLRAARRVARSRNTSISRIFSRFVRAVSRKDAHPAAPALPPLTNKALGLLGTSSRRADREVLEDALLDRHGIDA